MGVLSATCGLPEREDNESKGLGGGGGSRVVPCRHPHAQTADRRGETLLLEEVTSPIIIDG